MSPERSRAWRQLAVSYVATNALVFALARPASQALHLHDLMGAVFLLAAWLSVRADDNDTARYGIRLGGLFPGAAGDDRSLLRTLWESLPGAGREVFAAACVLALVLPLYALGWPLFNIAPPVRALHLDAEHLRDWAVNVLAIALTEEVYFRGYFQTRLLDALGRAPASAAEGPEAALPLRALPRALWRAAPALALTSLLFAVTHLLVEVNVPRAAVFFPSLLFGAVRLWRGGVGAAVLVHAASNVFEGYLEGR